MPERAARSTVERRVHATQAGGCGFWTGLGTTLRGGILMYFPSNPVKGVSARQPMRTSNDSSHCSRLVPGSTLNPSSSATEEDSPVPSSKRPFEMQSRLATRSAVRAGWLMLGGRWTMPCPSRMFLPRWLAAARNISGAEAWQYSSKEVVLGDPHAVDPHLVGCFDKLQMLFHHQLLTVVAPGARER